MMSPGPGLEQSQGCWAAAAALRREGLRPSQPAKAQWLNST